PGQGSRDDVRRHPFLAAVHREQAEVLAVHRRGRRPGPRPTLPGRDRLHPLLDRLEVGRAAQHRVHELHQPVVAPRGLPAAARGGREGQRDAARAAARAQVRAAVQGTRRRRRRADAHPQGPAQRDRRQVRRHHRRDLRRHADGARRHRDPLPGRHDLADPDRPGGREAARDRGRRPGGREGRGRRADCVAGEAVNTDLLVQLLVNGVIIGTLYGVVAMCFVLIYKSTQIVNFAQGEFLLIGAWICWWLLTSMKVPFWLGFPLTLVFMTAFGILLQVLVLRPMIGEPIISVIMVTIGLSIFFQAMMKWMFGVWTAPFPEVFSSKSMNILGLNVQTPYIMSMLISLVIMAGFAWFFKFSRMGLAMRATAFNQQVAQSLGISVRTVFAAAWAISAVVSALAGVVVGMVNGVSQALSFFGIKVFPAVILGGLDSIVGAIVGGLIIGVLENLAEFVDSQCLNWGNLYTVAPFYALIVILMIKPYGLFGTKQIERI